MANFVQIQSFKDLVTHLEKEGKSFNADSAEQAIVLSPDAAGGASTPVVVRWDKKDPLIHVLQPMVAEVPAERAVDVAVAIARMNDQAKMPGLGYNQRTRLIYYRISMVVLPDGIRSDLLMAMIRGAGENAKEVLGTIRHVVEGSAPEATGRTP